MLVPETTVNENDLAQSRENHVWHSGKVTRMEAVAEAHAMHQAANNHLWTRIHALNAGHPFASLLS
jgi:hypothetical protein